MLPEINPITRTELNARMKNIADNIERQMLNCKEFREYYLTLTESDLTSLGYSSESQAYIGSFSVALLNLYEAYKNTTKTGTADPSYFVNLFSSPTLF